MGSVSGRRFAWQGGSTHSRLGDDVVVCAEMIREVVGQQRSAAEPKGTTSSVRFPTRPGDGERGEGGKRRTELEGDAAEGRAVLGDVEENVLQPMEEAVSDLHRMWEEGRGEGEVKRTLMLGAVERPRRKIVDIVREWTGTG